MHCNALHIDAQKPNHGKAQVWCWKNLDRPDPGNINNMFNAFES